jgi:hypothetical protein
LGNACKATCTVVPAKAGTHNHRIGFGEDSELKASRHNFSLGV